MSRTAFIVAAAAGALLLQVVTSNAQTKPRSSSTTSIGVLAKSKDPAGNYSTYPDWARFALAPGSGRGR